MAKQGNSYEITDENKFVLETGIDIILNQMSDDEHMKLGNKSHTLHFFHLLVLGSQKSTRTIKGSRDHSKTDGKRKQIEDYKPIGVTLFSDEPIDIPVIDVKKNRKTGISKEDVVSRGVEANELFDLTFYEFMYLMIRPEYGGFLEYKGNPQGARLHVYMADYKKGKDKFPNPRIKLASGSVRDVHEFIDRPITPNSNRYEILPQYERFGPLVTNKGRKKNPTESPPKPKAAVTASDPMYIAVALHEALFNGVKLSEKDEGDLKAEGKRLIEAMDEESRAILGSKSGTLHIVKELNYRANRRDSLIALRLISDVNIEVPTIPVTTDYFALVDYATNINPKSLDYSRTVRAGEEFNLTLYEFMFLTLRKEYVGFCVAHGNPMGAYLAPVLKAYLEGKSTLPSPKISYVNPQNEQPMYISDIVNGVTQIKPEFMEKFGDLLPK